MKKWLLLSLMSSAVLAQGADSGIVVENMGICGASSKAVVQKSLDNAVAASPELTIVMVGTNDMINSQALASLSDYEANLRVIIAGLKAADSKIIMVNLPPCSEELLFLRHKKEAFADMPPNERIVSANEIIARVCAAERVPMVDFYRVVADKGFDSKDSLIIIPANNPQSRDGVHPTAAGYETLARQIKACMDRENIKAVKIVCLGDSITFGAFMKGQGTAEGNTYPAKLKQLLGEQKQ